jgi:hypothetical protein
VPVIEGAGALPGGPIWGPHKSHATSLSGATATQATAAPPAGFSEIQKPCCRGTRSRPKLIAAPEKVLARAQHNICQTMVEAGLPAPLSCEAR